MLGLYKHVPWAVRQEEAIASRVMFFFFTGMCLPIMDKMQFLIKF